MSDTTNSNDYETVREARAEISVRVTTPLENGENPGPKALDQLKEEKRVRHAQFTDEDHIHAHPGADPPHLELTVTADFTFHLSSDVPEADVESEITRILESRDDVKHVEEMSVKESYTMRSY